MMCHRAARPSLAIFVIFQALLEYIYDLSSLYTNLLYFLITIYTVKNISIINMNVRKSKLYLNVVVVFSCTMYTFQKHDFEIVQVESLRFLRLNICVNIQTYA